VLIYWSALTLGPVVAGASLTLTSYALSASRGLVAAIPGGLGILLSALEVVLLIAGLTGLFHFLPNAPVRWRHAFAGALVATLGLEAAKKGLAWYVDIVPTYSVVYGAFATLPILLLWIYLVWVIVLLGAEVAACAPTIALELPPSRSGPGSRFGDGVGIVRALSEARAAGQAGLSAWALADRLRLDPQRIEEALGALTGLDWVGRLENDREQRQVLLVDPATTAAKPLIDRLLLGGGDVDLANFRRSARLDALRLADLIE
jgi:membrane protein